MLEIEAGERGRTVDFFIKIPLQACMRECAEQYIAVILGVFSKCPIYGSKLDSRAKGGPGSKLGREENLSIQDRRLERFSFLRRLALFENFSAGGRNGFVELLTH